MRIPPLDGILCALVGGSISQFAYKLAGNNSFFQSVFDGVFSSGGLFCARIIKILLGFGAFLVDGRYGETQCFLVFPDKGGHSYGKSDYR